MKVLLDGSQSVEALSKSSILNKEVNTESLFQMEFDLGIKYR
ncbi:hypothetical protein ACFLTP_08685 [Chloroflexota bacterium]